MCNVVTASSRETVTFIFDTDVLNRDTSYVSATLRSDVSIESKRANVLYILFSSIFTRAPIHLITYIFICITCLRGDRVKTFLSPTTPPLCGIVLNYKVLYSFRAVMKSFN